MSEINKVIAVALRSKEKTAEARSLKRDLSKGNTKYTEHYAYKHIIPYTSEKDEDKALKIAALIARNNIAQNSDIRFGQWVKLKAEGDPNTLDKLGRKLTIIVNLNFEQAIEQINRLIQQLEKPGDSFDWIGLGNTLFYWGKGVTDNSLKVRQRILGDFYRYLPKDETTKEKE